MRAAAIGIGSNSVRMLLADITDKQGVRLMRDRAGTRLFAGLDEKRNLSRTAMDTSAESVRLMAETARQQGADEIILFATSATRDAANADVFASLLKDTAGLDLLVLTGEEEAMLSFYGASGNGHCGVIDIGGGSTEIIIGRGLQMDVSMSCQMGAVRLSRMLPIACEADLAAVLTAAEEILQAKLQQVPSFDVPPSWFGTGGTFTTLAAMVNCVPWTDRTQMHGTRLSLDHIEKAAYLLAPLSLSQRQALPGLQPNRADIIVHGICILLAVMRHFGLSEITVSEYGNLDGFLKDHYGLTQLV